MIYKCEPCKYQTERKDTYERHLLSSLHDSSAKFKCKYCLCTYVRHSNMLKHIVSCTQKSVYETSLEDKLKLFDTLTEKNITLENQLKLFDTMAAKNKDIQDKNKDLEDKNKILEDKLATIQQQYQDNLNQQLAASAKLLDKADINTNMAYTSVNKLIDNSGTLVNNSLNTINKTVNALTYINKTFDTTPAIQPLLNYDMFKKPKDGQLVEELIHYHRQKMLSGYIGDVYIKEYVKDNPMEQGIWNTDNTRLTYYVRVILDKNKIVKPTKKTSQERTNKNNPEWVADKKGILISDYTLQPILDFLSSEITKYINTKTTYMLKYPKKPTGKIMSNLTSCGDISILIDNGKLKIDILKYIAPKFDLSRTKKSYLQIKSGNDDSDDNDTDDYEDDEDDQDQEEDDQDEDDQDQEEDDQDEDDQDQDEDQCNENLGPDINDNISECDFTEQAKIFNMDDFGYHHNMHEPEDI
jgi:hypothetical protein